MRAAGRLGARSTSSFGQRSCSCAMARKPRASYGPAMSTRSPPLSPGSTRPSAIRREPRPLAVEARVRDTRSRRHLPRSQIHATYGQWAARSAGLGARMLAAGLAPGDRILLFMRNHPRYLEVMWAAWWAGLVVVPVNAKLHPREVEWIIADAQARWGFVTSDVAPDALAGLERQIDVESEHADALMAPLSDADERSRHGTRSERRRVAVLHQRHDGSAEGRDDHPPQPHDDGADLFRRCGHVSARRRHRLCGADVAWRGTVCDTAPDGRCPSRGAGSPVASIRRSCSRWAGNWDRFRLSPRRPS